MVAPLLLVGAAAWLREHGARNARFTGLAEYVLGALLGDVPMSMSMASGTGLLELRRLDWDPEACELAGDRPEQLLRLAPDGWHGRLNAEHARRWPKLAGARWAASGYFL